MEELVKYLETFCVEGSDKVEHVEISLSPDEIKEILENIPQKEIVKYRLKRQFDKPHNLAIRVFANGHYRPEIQGDVFNALKQGYKNNRLLNF